MKHALDLNDPARNRMQPGAFDDLEPVEGETEREKRRRKARPAEGMVQIAVCTCGEELTGRNQRQIAAKFKEHAR